LYKTFNNWIFDGSSKSKIPIPKTADDGTIIVPDILKYNSPITHTYIVSMFLKNSSLNSYLNKHFNNINLRYIDKEELFYFIKKCVIDFRISRRSMVWKKYTHKTVLFKTLRKKIPILKNDDIDLLADVIEKSEDKDKIYVSLNLDKPKKVKSKKKKIKKGRKISLQDYIQENFSVMSLESNS
jgi:hypothetical protein